MKYSYLETRSHCVNTSFIKYKSPGEMLSVLKSPQMTEKIIFSSSVDDRCRNDINSVWTSFNDLRMVNS